MAKIDHLGILLRVNCVIQTRKCYDKLVQNTGRKLICGFGWRSIYYSSLHESKEVQRSLIFKGLRNSRKTFLVGLSMKQRNCELISTIHLSRGVPTGFVTSLKPRPHFQRSLFSF